MTVMTALATAPVWLPFAAKTLIAKQRRRIPKHCTKPLEADPYREPSEPPEAPSSMINLTDEWAAQHGSPEIAFSVKRSGRIGTTMELLATLRLCATFGDSDAARALCDPAAITVIDVGHPGWISPVSKAVGDLLPNYKMFRRPDRHHGGDLLIIAPASDENLSNPRDASRFAETISDALAYEVPLLLITGGHRGLPERITRILPPAIRLAPIDAEMVLAMLHWRFEDGDARWHERLLQALPSAGMLRRLRVDALHAAYRQTDGMGVVRTLADQAEALIPSDGPTLEDLAEGGGDAVAAARRLMADLALWADGKLAWGDALHSLLLVGAPGTGKTFLARSMVRGTDIPLIQASFAQWQAHGHLGATLRAMSDSFAEAISAAPCLLFIDEIDAAGSRQSDDRHGASYRRQVIDAFLEQVDIAMRAEGIVLVGACNDVQALDPAILRPGRFDSIVEVPLPGRKALSTMLTRALGDEIDPHQLDNIVTAAVGATPAVIDAAIRAARSHAREQGRRLQVDDVLGQLQGSQPPERFLMWRIAVHEVGHAILAAERNLGTITRITLGHGDGATMLAPDLGAGMPQDHHDMIAYTLAGRAAETVIFGTPGGGSGGPERTCDLAVATRIALAMETSYGGGTDGLAWSPASTDRRITDPALRQAVRKTLDDAQARARHMLEHHRGLLLEMSKDLLRHRMLEGEALQIWIDRITADAPWDPSDPYGRRALDEPVSSGDADIIDLVTHRAPVVEVTREPP